MIITKITVIPVNSGDIFLRNVSFDAPLNFIIPIGIYNFLVYYENNKNPIEVFGKKVSSPTSLANLLKE